MKSGLVTLFSLVRIRHWWYSKIPMYLAIGLALGVNYYSFRQDLIHLFLLFTWLVGGASFGYFLNDCFDIEQDKAAGKPNASEAISLSGRIILLIILAGISILPWLLSGRPDLIALALGQICVFMFYSIRPLRLKDRLYAGIAADSLYAYLIPCVMILMLYKDKHSEHTFLLYTAVPLIAWAAATGMRAILFHHVEDRKKDAATAVGNVVNRFGLKTNIIILKILLGVELIAFCLFYFKQPYVFIKILFLLLYTFLLFVSFNRFGIRISFKRKIHTGELAFFDFYEKWLLLVLSLLAADSDWRYSFLALLFIMLFMIKTVLVRLYYILIGFYYKIVLRFYFWVCYRLIIPGIYILLFNLIRPPLSFIVNHSIYFFRRLALGLSDSEARSRTTYLPFTEFFNVQLQTKKDISTNISGNVRKHNNELEFATGPLTENNKKVNGLWIGTSLSKIELLTIKSFIDHGHEFHLWVYEPIKTTLPEAVIIEDANEIIDASKIFRYKYTNHFGHGKGSVSGFSDIFRYKLLYEKGGWWTDMDMTCLRPLEIQSPYFFRSHHELFLVGNIMKVPKESELMRLCYREASETIDENNRDWHKPIEILDKYVDRLGLDRYVYSGYSNEDKWDEVKLYAKGKANIPDKYMVLHWMNEEWRSRKMDKDDLRISSTLAKKMIKHSIIQMPKTKAEVWSNEIRHLLYLPLIE